MSLRTVIKGSAIGNVIWPFLHDEKAKYYQRKTNRECRKACCEIEKASSDIPHIFFCGVCETSNMGDMAQTYCTYEWLKKNYPGYQILECKTTFLYDYSDKKMIRLMKDKMRDDDIIFFQSGYNTHDLGGREDLMHQLIMTEFPKTEMIMLPQTVYFKSEARREQAARVYNGHHKLLFFARDPVSEQYARNMFPDIHVELYPDIVTSLIGRFPIKENKREGIWLCRRNDVEQFYKEEDYARFTEVLSKWDQVTVGDTIVTASPKEIRENLLKAVGDMVNTFAKYRLIVTDKYHGLIFSLVSNTPVIVLRTKDHKVTSGYEWFCRIFPDRVFFASDEDELIARVDEVLKKPHYNRLDDYFAREYYDKMKEHIEEWENAN